MRTWLASMATLALAACLVGCGRGDDDDDSGSRKRRDKDRRRRVAVDLSSPEATLRTVHEASKAGDAEAFLACCQEPVREQFAEMLALANELAELDPEAAASEMRDKLGMMAEAKDTELDIGDAKIEGDRATLEVTMRLPSDRSRKRTLPFVREADGWKMEVPKMPASVLARGMRELRRRLAAARRAAEADTATAAAPAPVQAWQARPSRPATAPVAPPWGRGAGDYSSPKATFQTMWQAAKAGDKAAFVACLRESDREKLRTLDKIQEETAKLTPGSRGKRLGLFEDLASRARESRMVFGEETIRGDTAMLNITSNGKRDAARFVRETGGWKVSLRILDGLIERERRTLERLRSTKRK